MAPVRPALHLDPLSARRFVLRAQSLETPFPNVAAALSHLGYVQIDPLNICGRMHDLILRNRVSGYREGDLTRHLHGAGEAVRTAFEHHHPETHVLVAFPLEAWPHLLGAMRSRSRETSAWYGRLTPRERKLAPGLLAEIAARGPLGSEDFADRRRAHRQVWGAATLVKNTLQKLFFHGRLLIAQRSNGRRRYDLPERILPPSVLALPESPPEETACWLARLKLRQRRLARLTRSELNALDGTVQPVTVDGCPAVYCLPEDVSLLESAHENRPDVLSGPDIATSNRRAAVHPKPRLLAPLDPVIYDRRLTAALWNFDYTWEAYTPAAKRVRGHYALPILAGTELIGHVEPKADRERGRLRIGSRSVRRGHSIAPALDELAIWLGLKR